MAAGRQWRLIEVDASLADIDRHRSHLLGEFFQCQILLYWKQELRFSPEVLHAVSV